tara:strand:- start:2543 stop:3313 length:771 start_codon:yes stop_codon:yes gene_type:complete
MNIINRSYSRLSKNRVLTIEVFIASLALFFQAPQVFAGRPFDGTDPALVGVNEFEIKLGPLDFKRDASKLNWHTPMFGLNYGLTENWELNFGVEAERADHHENRFRENASEIGVKHLLRKGSIQGYSGLSVAMELSFEKSSEVATKTGSSLAAIIGNQWDWGSLYLNVATERTPEQENEVFTGIIFEGNSDNRLRPVVEFTRVSSNHASPEYAGLLGFIYEPFENIAFDFAVKRTHGNEGSESVLRFGATFVIGGS